MMFIERRAEAANDPVFGRVGETKQIFQRRNPRASRQPLPPSLNEVRGPKTRTMAVQVGPSEPAKSDKESNSTTLKVKCYGCESTHKIKHCPDFISKSIRQRIVFARYKGLCLNCLHKGHFVSECQSTFKCKHCQQPPHCLLHKPIDDKEGTLANPKEGPGPREQANVNTVTTAPVETASHTYSTTSRTKVVLQVVPVKIMSKKKKILLLHMRCLILGVKRHFSPRLFVINLDYKLATGTTWLSAHCRASPQLKLVKPMFELKLLIARTIAP